MAKPRRYDIAFTQNDGWSIRIAFSTKDNGVTTPRNVSASTFLAQIRRRPLSPVIIATIHTYTSANNAILVNPLATNEVLLILYPEQTIVVPEQAWWSIRETGDGATPQTKLKGMVVAVEPVSEGE